MFIRRRLERQENGETRKTDELAVIETETKKFRKITLEKMKEAWKTVFKKKEK